MQLRQCLVGDQPGQFFGWSLTQAQKKKIIIQGDQINLSRIFKQSVILFCKNLFRVFVNAAN